MKVDFNNNNSIRVGTPEKVVLNSSLANQSQNIHQPQIQKIIFDRSRSTHTSFNLNQTLKENHSNLWDSKVSAPKIEQHKKSLLMADYFTHNKNQSAIYLQEIDPMKVTALEVPKHRPNTGKKRINLRPQSSHLIP